jgi:amino acid transporter
MFDIQPLLKLSYWFDKRPPGFEPFFQQSLFFFFGALVVLALVITVVVKKKKKESPWIAKGFQKISSWCLSMGIAGLIIFFFTYERIPLLSMRFWYIVWLVGAVVWLVFIVRFFMKKIPEEKARIAEQKNKEKYLPGKNKK